MNIKQAKIDGAMAFCQGKGRAPALNQKFLKEACGAIEDTNELLKAYLHGWDIAMLAGEADDDNYPSVIEYKNIMGINDVITEEDLVGLRTNDREPKIVKVNY